MLWTSLIAVAVAEPRDAATFESELRLGVPRDEVGQPGETGIATYRAVLFAAREYREAGVLDLDTTIRDAEALGARLESSWGFEVTIVADPTRDDVFAELDALFARSGPDDAVLVYWAGHGAVDEVEERGYWWPVDAERFEPRTWVDHESLRARLRTLEARHLWIVSDAPFGTRATTPAEEVPLGSWTDVRAATARRSRVVLTSGGQRPVPSSRGEGSALAVALLTVLGEAKARFTEPGRVLDGIRPFLREVDQTPRLDRLPTAYDEGGALAMVDASSCDHATAEVIADRDDGVRIAWQGTGGRSDADAEAVRGWLEMAREPVAIDHCGRPVEVRFATDLVAEAEAKLVALETVEPPPSPLVPLVAAGGGLTVTGGVLMGITGAWKGRNADSFEVVDDGVVVASEADRRRFATQRTLNRVGIGLIAAGLATAGTGVVLHTTGRGTGLQVTWHGRW